MLRRYPSDRWFRRWWLLTGVLVGACPGCTGGEKPTDSNPPQPAIAATANLTQSDATSAAPHEKAAADDLRARTKWVGDIPYDVFFDDPLSVAADARPVDGKNAAPSLAASRSHAETIAPVEETAGPLPAAGEAASTDRSAGPESPSSAVDWQRLANAEILNDEVKQLRNRLTANLRTVASFNQNLEAIHNDALILAILAAVIDAHPGSLSWKENARSVRDVAARLAHEAVAPGREAFSKSQIAYEQLVVLLDGGPPPDDDPPGAVPFSDVADRSELMKRIKRSFEWLRAELNTEQRFREDPNGVVHEAALLAVLGGVVSTESYGSTDEPQYQQYVAEFIAGSTGMADAAVETNYQNFIGSRDRVQNSCAACHGEYAFGEEGL